MCEVVTWEGLARECGGRWDLQPTQDNKKDV